MFKTYNASAGSGKTTNLVAEYLSICLKNTDCYRNVLAVTFTNNATAEMKTRILNTLNDFAFTDASVWNFFDEQPDSVKKELGRSRFIHKTTQELSQLDADTIQKRAVELLEKILADYPHFAISTIDSFFQHIVRSFAFDLGLSTDFNVEISLDDYFQQTVDLMFQRISKDNPESYDLAKRVISLIDQQLEETGKWRVDFALIHLLKQVYGDELADENLELLKNVDFEKVAKQLSSNLKTAQNQYDVLVANGLQILADSGIPEDDFPKYGIWTWFVKAKEGELKSYSAIDKAIEGASFTKSRKADLSENDRETIIALKSQIENLHSQKILPCVLILRNLKRFQLVFDLRNIMSELREQDNKFFLSETGRLIQKEIKDNPVPYIYSKVGSRFSNYFIDEFQDTSDTQWDNMLPLLDEAVSQAQPSGKAILFGDVKQAIYRFRNGNPQLFADLTKSGTARYNHFSSRTQCEEKLLDANHRTCQKIVSFNNLFFDSEKKMSAFPNVLRDCELYDDFYKTVKQKFSKEDDGFVAIRFFEEKSKEENRTDVSEESSEETPKANVGEYFLQSVMDAIADARARGFRFRDIAVLTRTTSMGTDVGKSLAANGIPVISGDSLVLGASDEVNLLVGLIRYIEHPNDSLTKFMVAHWLLERNKKGNIAPFIHQISGFKPSFSKITDSMTTAEKEQALSENKEKERSAVEKSEWMFTSFLKENFGVELQRSLLQRHSLTTLTHFLIKQLKLTDANSYVVGFLDLISDYEKEFGSELSPFLEWWDKKGCQKAVTSPDDIDAVKIMTIHKSKGKEFPVVIMPLRNKRTRLTRPNVWLKMNEEEFGLPVISLQKSDALDKSFSTNYCAEEKALTMLDEMNVIYVGQTRPEEALYIIADAVRPEKSDDKSAETVFRYSWMLSDFIQDHSADFQEDGKWNWFGNKNHHSLKNKAVTSVSEELSKEETAPSLLPVSDFSLDRLVVPSHETEKQEIGIAIHHFFETTDHFPQTLSEVDSWSFGDDETYAEEIRAALRTLVSRADVLPYFADGLSVWREVSLLSETGDKKRPDRVVLLPNETVVIDFKTGEPNQIAEEKYQKQLDEYVNLLTQMNFPNVKGVLLYL